MHTVTDSCMQTWTRCNKPSVITCQLSEMIHGLHGMVLDAIETVMLVFFGDPLYK